MYPPVHERPENITSFDRLSMLWDRYPQHHEMTTFATLDELLENHESYREGFDEVREEYAAGRCEQFLIQLSWADLPYRQATKELIEAKAPAVSNGLVNDFLSQFQDLDTDRCACFLFPECESTQFLVVWDVCRGAEQIRPVLPLLPDEEEGHFLAVFDKKNMDDILMMYHLLYTNPGQEMAGGYRLYDYTLPWYQNHLREDEVVLRSPYLPDRLARYLGELPYYHNPAKTVCVRRNIRHMLERGYFSSELDLFLQLTTRIMPLFQWWYEDVSLYETKDGCRTDWKACRMLQIRTRLTAEGVIRPKWKHELSLFHLIRRMYPDTIYQYWADWLGQQSLDLFIPSENVGIEYQGIQHFVPVEFFGGDEALTQRQVLDQKKRQVCEEKGVRLIEWPYDMEATEDNLRIMLGSEDGEHD